MTAVRPIVMWGIDMTSDLTVEKLIQMGYVFHPGPQHIAPGARVCFRYFAYPDPAPSEWPVGSLVPITIEGHEVGRYRVEVSTPYYVGGMVEDVWP